MCWSLSLINEAAELKLCNLIKKRPQSNCFPESFAKCLRTPFFMKHIQWLLLSFDKTGTQILRKINSKPACICHGLAMVRTSGNALNDRGWKWGLTSLLGQPFHKNNLYINSFVWSSRSPRSLVKLQATLFKMNCCFPVYLQSFSEQFSELFGTNLGHCTYYLPVQFVTDYFGVSKIRMFKFRM